MSEPGAEVISIDEERTARGRGGGVGRARCAARTADGRACRNHAVTGSLCGVHASRGGASGEPAATADDWGDTGGAPEGAAGEVERLRALAGGAGVEVVDGLREALGGGVGDQVREVAAFARRRLVGDYDVDEFGFDEDFTRSVLVPLVRPLYRHYWRVASHGADNLPDAGGLIVANHAGTLPFDAVMTRLDIFEQTGRHARELGADLLFRTPFLGHLGRKSGATLAAGGDAGRLLDAGELVAVWPEGFKGIGKRFKDRYRLARFGRGGFVATALRSQVPIVPTAIVGSEEIYPLLHDARILARMLGLPYFPIVAQMLAVPLLGPLAALPLPSKWVIEYGEPIDTAELGPEAADDPMAVFDLTDRVRETIQAMLYRNLMGRRSVFF